MRRLTAWTMIIVGGLSFGTLAIVDIATGSSGRGPYEVRYVHPGEVCDDAVLYLSTENGETLYCRGGEFGSPAFETAEYQQITALATTLGQDGLDRADRKKITGLAGTLAARHDDYRPRRHLSDSPVYVFGIGAGFLALLIGIAHLQAIRRRPAEPQ